MIIGLGSVDQFSWTEPNRTEMTDDEMVIAIEFNANFQLDTVIIYLLTMKFHVFGVHNGVAFFCRWLKMARSRTGTNLAEPVQ